MLNDLSSVDGPTEIQVDVAIVGAGIAGLVLGTRLANSGLNVAVLESGGLQPDTGINKLNEVVTDRYQGGTFGRTRGLGGTSAIWGGALIPFPPEDFAERPEWEMPSWPITYNDLAPYLGEAEKLFELCGGPYRSEAPSKPRVGEANPEFVLREAKWPKFAKRNIASLLKAQIKTDRNLQVWLLSTVTDFEVDPLTNRIRKVEAKGEGLQSLCVSAKSFVLCMGAIETTKAMLLLDRQLEGRISENEKLGSKFQDHISVPLATIETSQPDRLNAFFGFRFDRSSMRSLRFELSGDARQRRKCNAGFVHIAPRPLEPTGFHSIREFFRSIQNGKMEISHLFRAAGDGPFLLKLAFWRLVKKRLYWPQPSAYEVHFVIEQTPTADNRITLSQRSDRYGKPLAQIDWKVGELDRDGFRALAQAFDLYWADAFKDYGTLKWFVRPEYLELKDVQVAEDIYHPVGTTPMGASPSEGVLDSNLQVYGIPNLFVCSTSAFPRGGTSNPTMTMILFTLRLADHLAKNPEGSR